MKRSRHKKRRHVPIPVASMGDIAFLLIIFFMLLSEFAKDRDLALEPPTSQHVEKPEQIAAVRVGIDENGAIYLDGQPVQSVKDVEWGVRALLTDTVTDDQRHVQLKVDRDLPYETYQPVIKAIAEGGGILQAVGELPE